MLADVDLFDVLATVSEPSSRRSTTLSHWPGRVVVRQGSPEPRPQLVVESSAEVSVDGVAGTTMAPGVRTSPRSRCSITSRPGLDVRSYLATVRKPGQSAMTVLRDLFTDQV